MKILISKLNLCDCLIYTKKTFRTFWNELNKLDENFAM